MNEPMRSLMYVPANRQHMVERGLAIGEHKVGELDVVMLDLEDGVPVAEKPAARAIIAASLGVPSNGGRGPVRWVRVNPLDSPWRREDLAAALRPGIEGIVIPKVESAADLAAYARALDPLEKAAGLAAGSVRLCPLVESARGIISAFEIASASPRIIGVLLGIEDYALDLGLPEVREGEAADVLYARSALVNACVAARVLPFDSAFPDFKDQEGLRRDALLARRLGFVGKSLISPGQIAVTNEVFSPSATEIARARAVVKAFDEGEAKGMGAINFEGKMIDRPIVERARRTVRVADAMGR